MKTIKTKYSFALVAAAVMLSAGLAFADDSLFITLPGETFVNTAGNAGAPTNQTVGTAFAIKIHATTDNVSYITDTAFSGVKTLTSTRPRPGRPLPHPPPPPPHPPHPPHQHPH